MNKPPAIVRVIIQARCLDDPFLPRPSSIFSAGVLQASGLVESDPLDRLAPVRN